MKKISGANFCFWMSSFLSRVLSGCHSGPGRFLDSLGTPLKPFLGREAARVLLGVSLFVLFCFSSFVVFAATLFSRRK